MITASCVVFLALAAVAAPPAHVVAASTAATASLLGVSTHTISSLYTGDRVRDPFMPASMGGSAPQRAIEEGDVPAVTDIHSLQLHGLMKDRANDFAIFGSDTGQTYLLRAGKLFDGRNKRVPGVTGRIQLKQKRVELITADKDVQVFVLGEVDENKDKKP